MAPQKKLVLIGGGAEDGEILREALAPDGYTVIHTPDGRAGLETAAERGPDLFVLDRLDDCVQLRQSAEHAETPILWLALADGDAETAAALRAGADEILRSPIEALEARVRVRTAVHASELRQRAREIQHLRKDFVDQLVHDLRSPLQIVLGFSELLGESTEMPEPEQGHVRSIWSAARRLERLADNLIVSAGLETGDLRPRSQPLAPLELAGQVVEAMRPVAALKSITLTLDGEAGSGRLCADEDLIRRALHVLVENAVRLSPAGSTVGVRAAAGGASAMVAFEVADRGPDMAQAERERVFDLQHQLALRRAGRARSGRGLGLSLCHQVAVAHGGRARVEANPGGGSVFILELPGAVG